MTAGSDDDDAPLEGGTPPLLQHPGLPMSVGTVIGSDGVVRPAHSPYVCMAAPVSTQGGVLIPRGMAAGAHQVAGGLQHGYTVHPGAILAPHHVASAPPRVMHPATRPPVVAPPPAVHQPYAVSRASGGACYLAAAPAEAARSGMQPAPYCLPAQPRMCIEDAPPSSAPGYPPGPEGTVRSADASGEVRSTTATDAGAIAGGSRNHKRLSIHAPERSLVNTAPQSSSPVPVQAAGPSAGGAAAPGQIVQQQVQHAGTYVGGMGSYVLMNGPSPPAPAMVGSWPTCATCSSAVTPTSDNVDAMLNGSRASPAGSACVIQQHVGPPHGKAPEYRMPGGYAVGYQVISPVVSPLGLVVDAGAVFDAQHAAYIPNSAVAVKTSAAPCLD